MFSFQGQKLNDIVADPSERSNHLTGRAIDMNVWSASNGLCTARSGCLSKIAEDPDQSNQDAKCFIDKVIKKNLLTTFGY